MNKNLPILGFVIGALLPFLGFFAVYFIMFHSYDFSFFVSAIKRDHDQAAKVVTMSALINVLPFIYYSNRRLDDTARGIFIATILYAVLFVLLKFVW